MDPASWRASETLLNCSVMTLPANLHEKPPAEWLPTEKRKNGPVRLQQPREAAPLKGAALPEAVNGQQRLLRGELIKGGVLEICSQGGAALATTLALRAFRTAQKNAKSQIASSEWCAFVDPTRSLYAPGIRTAGVDPSRVLVVRPEAESLARITLRLVESQIFSVVVVDLMGLPGLPLNLPLGPWVRVVRRLSLALADSDSSVVLLTDYNAPRPLPLPVKDRILVTRSSLEKLSLRSLKNHTEREPTFVPRKALTGHVPEPSVLSGHCAS